LNNIINIGILGCANIATRSVIPSLLELSDQFKLVAIASRTHKKAVNCASQFNATAIEGYQTLLEMPELQAVYIPLPNALHAEWIERALHRGLNVLVEKSLACKFEDVVRLNNLARKKSLALVENFQFRFHSQLAFINNLLTEGSIGKLRCMRSSFGFPGLPNENDIRYNKELGGGALLDAGAYPLKIAQIFLGFDIEVKAANLNYIPEHKVDIWGGAYVKQKQGNLFGELAFGFDHQYQCSIELWGSKGKLFTNRIFTANQTHLPIIELETQTGKEIISIPADNHFKNMLMHFHSLINAPNLNMLREEYIQNKNQARLIKEIQLKAYE
jgi:dTDP-3,4-didehydro-2,6-dideoxy-alpha-D-glucose 3-reductase